jgi:hypothetical protein
MASAADVAMECEVVDEWAVEAADEDWDHGAVEDADEAADEDWDYTAAEDDAAVDGEEWGAMDWEAPEDTCHWCGSPAWFAGYPFCEGCDQANWRALLRAQHLDDDDATTAAGDPPEEFSDSDDWSAEYELD